MACIFFNSFTTRLQRLIGFKSKAAAANEKRASMQISAPFNFRHESVMLPGLAEDELAILKEKAVASVRFSGNDDGSFSSPRKAPCPRGPPIAVRTVAPVVTQSTPGKLQSHLQHSIFSIPLLRFVSLQKQCHAERARDKTPHDEAKRPLSPPPTQQPTERSNASGVITVRRAAKAENNGSITLLYTIAGGDVTTQAAP
ncbi:hypothetical protein GGS21DRAFT_488929 [Xylaria nigripes]|nr:hypothetical protein GGS21DRAFT_488929 [Xylaria nigripes]